MINKKRMKEKENFSSLMKGEASGLVSKKKVKRVCKSSQARDSSRIIVSATNTNGKIMGY